MEGYGIRDLLTAISRRGRALVGLTRSDFDIETAGIAELSDILLSERGEASGVAIASEILKRWYELDEPGRLAFMTALAARFGPDFERVDRAVLAYETRPDADTVRALHHAAEPRRQELFRRLNMAPGGTEGLLRMRECVLANRRDLPELAAVDEDFVHLFSSWFNRGFLGLERIDWSTPATILEKIIRYEAVHEISDWDDLRRRIAPADRRCFAFFHPQLAEDPLIFVEVALTREIPDSIGSLLGIDRVPIDPESASAAVFYSISNCQEGLQGISFGNFLIKQVVEDLKRELPGLTDFVTLSPAPGFAPWLRRELADAESALIDAEQRAALAALDREGWWAEAETVETLSAAVMPLAAHYFLKARTPNGRPVDPVARFHLRNGADLYRLNFPADLSANGLDQSFGLMVNYRYRLDDIEKNHEAFVGEGEVIAAAQVRRLLGPKSRREGRRESQGARAG